MALNATKARLRPTERVTRSCLTNENKSCADFGINQITYCNSVVLPDAVDQGDDAESEEDDESESEGSQA